MATENQAGGQSLCRRRRLLGSPWQICVIVHPLKCKSPSIVARSRLIVPSQVVPTPSRSLPSTTTSSASSPHKLLPLKSNVLVRAPSKTTLSLNVHSLNSSGNFRRDVARSNLPETVTSFARMPLGCTSPSDPKHKASRTLARIEACFADDALPSTALRPSNSFSLEGSANRKVARSV